MTEDEKVVRDLQRLGKLVDSQLPYGWGWIILTFPFGADGRMNYISNAERADVIRTMYEFIAATKQGWAEHVPDAEPGSQAEDELIGRLRQEVAALEHELEIYRKRYG